MELMRSLVVYLALTSIASWPLIRAQSPINNTRNSLDALLQNYAFQAIAANPRTGTVFDAKPPSNLSGITLAALRLRSGSMRKRRFSNFKTITIPVGVIAEPYVVRLVLVYQNLGNWSSKYYDISGYTFLTPVIGLLAYNASNLSATNLDYLQVRASMDPISIQFTDVRRIPDGSNPKCIRFYLNGSHVLSNFTSKSNNTCWTYGPGHFSIIVESIAPSPAPSSPPPVIPSGPPAKNDKWRVLKIAVPVIGGSALLVLLALLVLWLRKYKQHKKIEEMEQQAEMGEALQIISIGESKAPMAMGTRTPPMLETE